MRMRFRALSFVGRPILAAAAFQAAKPGWKAGCGHNCPPHTDAGGGAGAGALE